MNFLETSEPITQNEVFDIEKDIKVKFPNEFVEHYLKYNGGYPEKDTYMWKGGEETTINTFLSLKYEGFGNIESTYKNLAIVEGYLPTGIVPFATDDGGNFFCISSRKRDYGRIFYFNNDAYDTTNKETAMSQLEESFIKFIKKLS